MEEEYRPFHQALTLKVERNNKVMNKKNNFNDFRTTRHKLPPEAFAVGPEGPDSPPEDLVEKEIWEGIISLTDDVSFRTSDNHGIQLKIMYKLWASWIDSLGEEQDAVWHTMLDAGDEFQACLFNSLYGYYRVAASCLRSALELNTIGTYLQLKLGPYEFSEWRKGKLEIKFGEACDHLINHSKTRSLQDYLKTKLNFSIFEQKSNNNPGGWTRRLHSKLSDSVHSLPTYSSATKWEGSNGPIYVPKSFMEVYALYLETMAIGYVLVKLARLDFELSQITQDFFFQAFRDRVLPSKVAVLSYIFLWRIKLIK